jgi:hypothetical protein
MLRCIRQRRRLLTSDDDRYSRVGKRFGSSGADCGLWERIAVCKLAKSPALLVLMVHSEYGVMIFSPLVIYSSFTIDFLHLPISLLMSQRALRSLSVLAGACKPEIFTDPGLIEKNQLY